MATLADWQKKQNFNLSNSNESNEDFNFGSEDSGWLASMAAAVPSGIFKIFEGVATLGATLLDLGVDKDRADSVETFFDKINPFDEAASATAAGKITELIINLGVPGAPAFRIGSGLAKATLRAKEAGTYVSSLEKARRIGQGSLATGATDALFVGDVEQTGTFGDFLGGPTELDRKSDTPTAEILNRLKFGIEGAGFAGVIGGAGAGISALRNQKGTGKALEGTGVTLGFNKFFEMVSSGLRSRSDKNINQFLIGNRAKGAVDADTSLINEWRDTIDKTTLDLSKKYSDTVGNKISQPKAQNKMLEEMQDVLMSGTNERVLSKKGTELYEMYKKASVDPLTKKGKYKSEQAFLKDLINGKSNPVLVTGKKGKTQIKYTPTNKKFNLKNFTGETNPNKKMRPIFGTVDEIEIDRTTGLPFKNGFGVLKDRKPNLPLPKKIKLINPDTGKKELVNVKKQTIDPVTGKSENSQLYNVTLDAVDPQKLKTFRNKLIKTYKAEPKQVTDLLNTITGGREVFGEMFTELGRRITPDSYGLFQKSLKESLNRVVDRGYSVFRNNAGQDTVAKNYPPTKDVIKKTIAYYKKVAKQKGFTGISDETFEKLVMQTWRTATLDKGFILGTKKALAPGIVKFGSIPEFLTESVANTLSGKNKSYVRTIVSNLEEVSGVHREIIDNLLGKTKNPMSTLVDGVSNLSAQVRSGQAFDEMVRKNNILTKAWNRWDKGFTTINPKTNKETVVPPRKGPEPETPFLFDNKGLAQKAAGGMSDDFMQIGGGSGYAAREIDRWADPALPLKGVDEIEAKKIAEMTQVAQDLISNPLVGKYALRNIAKSFEATEESMKGLGAQIYNNLVLYPKGTSQMAKTILAPFTHVRNFVSATAFAGANGILPFGNTADVKAAWTALQSLGPGMKQNNPFYRMLLRHNIVNSNVRLNQVRDLLGDADFGKILNNKNSDWALNKLMQRLKKIKKGAEDYYTAEDDFWKIFSFLGEKSRINKAYKDSGLRLGQEFTDMNGVKRLFNDETLNDLSANLIRNNIPNYAYVSDFIKGLRKFPLGNFVAFPAEILRTGTNIVDTALKEINYTVKINGKFVKPLAARGRQRLMGMAITTAALPLGTIAAAETIYDITKDETAAMRRYVADWSKNSILIPFKDDEGKMSYIDFSHLNAYDTLTRPIQTVLRKVEEGRADEDGIMDDFILGLIESGKELLNPFVSESIWTEALQDVSPILGRDGTDSEGRRVWNPQDSIGDKMMKAISHLVEAQAPLNWKQLQRLGLSMYPTDSKGRFNKRGEEYSFGNELAGIAGMRRVEIKPERSFNYKITDYKKGIRDSRNLFTAATLKGGVVTPEQIVDAYINANRALYGVNRELYQDIEAAQILGMSEDALYDNMDNRGEKKAFNSLTEGVFRPLSLSKDIQDLFEIKAQEIGVLNPFEAAEDVIDRIKDVLETVPVTADFFPDIENPFSKSLISSAADIINPALPQIQTGTDLLAGVNIDQVQGITPNLDQQINKLNQIDSFIKT